MSTRKNAKSIAHLVFTNGFHINNTEIDCVDERDIEHKTLDQ
jgi:pantothenate kinase